jgi:hypothetical protein
MNLLLHVWVRPGLAGISDEPVEATADQKLVVYPTSATARRLASCISCYIKLYGICFHSRSTDKTDSHLPWYLNTPQKSSVPTYHSIVLNAVV